MTEAVFQQQVIDLARMCGWRVMHIGDSRRQVRKGGRTFLVGDTLARGWPDLVLCHSRKGRLLIRELKTDKGRVGPAQRSWLEDLARSGVDVGVWRPRDWPQIVEQLSGQTAMTEVA